MLLSSEYLARPFGNRVQDIKTELGWHNFGTLKQIL